MKDKLLLERELWLARADLAKANALLIEKELELTDLREFAPEIEGVIEAGDE